MESLKEFVGKVEYFVAAHRGASGVAPENTLASFRRAAEMGASLVEVDIQFTKDGEIVAFHDDELGRTAPGAGLISDFNYDELKDLDAGSWLDSKFNDEKIPTLGQVIDTIRGYCYIGIEIKPFYNPNIRRELEKLYEEVKKHDYADKTFFASCNYEALKIVKEIWPQSHIAAVQIPGDNTLPSVLAKHYGIESYICDLNDLTHEIDKDAYESGIVLGVYSIDTIEDLEKASKFNIKAWATNYPDKVVSYLSEKNRI